MHTYAITRSEMKDLRVLRRLERFEKMSFKKSLEIAILVGFEPLMRWFRAIRLGISVIPIFCVRQSLRSIVMRRHSFSCAEVKLCLEPGVQAC